MLKITQCLIVKNEERNLPRAIDWGKKIVDELIVVDTGSTDGTIPLAKKLGAKVLQFKWVDDFSAARNFAISQCGGDWIIFLDADEYFKDEDVPLLRPLIEKIDKTCVTEKGKKVFYNVIETPWVNLDIPARQARIFRNTPALRYTGAIHEQLHAMPGGYLKAYPAKGKPAIYHTGYLWSQENSKSAKAARNFEIARKALDQNPGCAKLMLFCAEALMDEGRFREADSYFSQALKNSDGSIWPERVREGYKQWFGNFMRLQDIDSDISDSGSDIRDSENGTKKFLESAVHAYTEAASKFPDDPDFDLLISLLHFKAKDVMRTIRYFNASLSKDTGRITKSIMDTNGETYKKLREACEMMKKANFL